MPASFVRAVWAREDQDKLEVEGETEGDVIPFHLVRNIRTGMVR